MRKITTCLALAAALLLPGAVIGAPPAAAQGAGSALTVSGSGEFADLKVTVDQTKNLINQAVRISWTGGKETVDLQGKIGGNFLQIMQCWGDDVEKGPDRTQCQFGATNNQEIVGNHVGSRVTGARSLSEVAPTGGALEVPFWPFDRERPTMMVSNSSNPFVDAQITNEVPAARTRPDGKGQVDFEMETLRQAAGLGCGTPVKGATTVRPCWLVIVPRGSTQLDGTVAGVEPVRGSPLDLRAWANRIVVRLDFLPQLNACPFGVERPVTGHEVVSAAVTRWQPALCANGATVYGFNKLNDRLIRDQLIGTKPELGIVSNPVPPDQPSPDRPLVYAPVTVSGLTFAFNIVADPPPALGVADDPRQALKGQQFTTMNLTPRLVAKLLTQSYQSALAQDGAAVPEGKVVSARPARLEKNPLSLPDDPDFLEVNPNFLADPSLPDRRLLYRARIDARVQAGTWDLTSQLWDWVLADPEARAFVDGVPDKWGMVVNDANKGLQPPLDTYPNRDQLCYPVVAPTKSVPFCPLDAHPFADDMNVAGRAASRGDSLGRSSIAQEDEAHNVTFAKVGRQPPNQVMLMSVVDAATAARYRLPTAKLRNAGGQFVAPDAAGLAAGVAAMKPSGVDGVQLPDPTSTNPAAYPLTTVSYAATSPKALDEAGAREYAGFLRYAAGPGQVPGEQPGQLPFGYLPLTEQMRAQTLAAAKIVENRGVTPAPPGDRTPPSNNPNDSSAAAPGPGGGSGSTGSGGGPTGSGSTASDGSTGAGAPSGSGSGVVAPAAPGGSAEAASGAPAAPSGTPAQVVAAARLTPALPAPAVGALLVALLIGGGLAAAAAPVTHLLGNRRLSPDGGDSTDRTATGSTSSRSTARSALFARHR